MFWKYSKTDKKKYLTLKLLVVVGIFLMAILAAHLAKLSFPTIESQLQWGAGIILVIVIAVFAFLNRIKMLFKVKSIGFLITFIILLLLRVGIDALIYATGLISIPLLIDDIFIVNYFKYLDVVKYGKQT